MSYLVSFIKHVKYIQNLGLLDLVRSTDHPLYQFYYNRYRSAYVSQRKLWILSISIPSLNVCHIYLPKINCPGIDKKP